MNLTTHKTLVGSLFFTKTRKNKKPKILLPKNKEEFLWVEEGLCPECKLKEVTAHALVTDCKICRELNIPLLK